jgi:hypothetical protein
VVVMKDEEVKILAVLLSFSRMIVSFEVQEMRYADVEGIRGMKEVVAC